MKFLPNDKFKNSIVGILLLFFFVMLFCMLGMMQSCTLTFQNTIATGSSDVVDSVPTTDPNISPEVTLPLIGS